MALLAEPRLQAAFVRVSGGIITRGERDWSLYFECTMFNSVLSIKNVLESCLLTSNRQRTFLFKQANEKQFGRKEDDDCGKECAAAFRFQLAMLTSWLPLLCRATNGTDAPILSSAERAEMVKVLEEMIEKLSWDQQEVVLALWLHHFTSCPDSDWPNLESCYTRWYSESRNLLLK